MRRFVPLLAAPILVLWNGVAACAYDPGPARPGVTGVSGITGPTGATAPTGSGTTEATGAAPASFDPQGCPIDDPAFCGSAAALANAILQQDGDDVFDLSVSERFDCAGLDEETFPQCDDRNVLKGYAVGDYQGHIFYLSADRYRGYLEFFVEAVDEEFTDEFGGSEPQIVGVSTCGGGGGRSYHLVYLVGLGDPDSTLPADRFLGTYELVERDGEWVVGASHVALYTDWQLELDDPLSQIACGDVEPWQD
jgi:hypothetical protein